MIVLCDWFVWFLCVIVLCGLCDWVRCGLCSGLCGVLSGGLGGERNGLYLWFVWCWMVGGVFCCGNFTSYYSIFCRVVYIFVHYS